MVALVVKPLIDIISGRLVYSYEMIVVPTQQHNMGPVNQMSPLSPFGVRFILNFFDLMTVGARSSLFIESIHRLRQGFNVMLKSQI